MPKTPATCLGLTPCSCIIWAISMSEASGLAHSHAYTSSSDTAMLCPRYPYVKHRCINPNRLHLVAHVNRKSHQGVLEVRDRVHQVVLRRHIALLNRPDLLGDNAAK